ncbi:MAG: glycosyltransferase [Lachnospiraceae bacterium]|jgi:glycosyltransferase involved in cell wall biosynthesis|uniref:glycosyltransferase family 2 protein n=1 Tax=Clostridium sp. (strain SY8519) TaxID=1042156 RepID=UPI0005A1B134|nr:glycosyltransferase [Clostridium sp. SY8519]MCI1654836.1 glycosyltransferase [Lachnospiraceae bacterium]MCI1657107.1 glycosyltransferase [Lachnospiraceae bacterium]MCI2195676.1 glycosyltransferase [Lachnospiraceae bacterium]HAD19718.1 glycosyl transferase [Lachnospiraceae bacterium]
MTKLLSIAVPCYNSQDYMDRCLKTLIPGGDPVEIIIVDDGSTDRTAEIADHYAQEYPSIIRVVHQENKGHGGALNTAMSIATGKYFKVVDSDDWVDEIAYRRILNTLASLTAADCTIDMLISNFVYEKVGARHKKRVHYHKIIPVNQLFGWKDARRFGLGKYFLMHSIIYRTALLRECGLKLPEHTFYVDNLFVYVPMPYVKRMYYLDVDFYRYYIGREDQSVNEKVMISRIDQQLRVNKLLIDAYDPWKIRNERLRQYMLNFIEIVTMVTTILLIKSNTDENIRKKREFWRYIKTGYPKLYRWLTRHFMEFVFNLPGKLGNKLVVVIYMVVQKVYGFN